MDGQDKQRGPFLMEYLSFWLKHQDQLRAMSSGVNSHLTLDLLNAIAPVLKKHYPNLSVNDLLDDTVNLLRPILGG